MTATAARRAAAKPFTAILRTVIDEIELSAQFIRSNAWSTIVAGTAFLVAAARYADLTAGSFAVALVEGLLYVWLYIYGFDLTNQLAGIEEDRLNKPLRPLVSGRASMHGTRIRAAVVLVAFPLVGWLLGVLVWALAWEALYLLHNLAGWSRNWFYKNLTAGGLGVVMLLAPLWRIAGPLDATAWRWILTLSATIMVLVPLQDLRDVTGDRAMARRTFPIIYGERFTRVFLCTGFAALPVATHFLLMRPIGGVAAGVADTALVALSWWIAIRVVAFRGPRADHVSYRRFEQWFVLALVSAVVLL